MATKIKGRVVFVRFCNPDSPFTTGDVRIEGGGKKPFAGKVVANEGDLVELEGEWVNDPKWGRQFRVDSGVVRMDESPDALVELLTRGKEFKGIGRVRASRIVDAALNQSDGDLGDALQYRADAIACDAGVPLELVQNAARVWSEKRVYYETLAALVEQGWTNGQASTIYAHFGDLAPHQIKADPYGLIGKIPRFGFRTVDAVALKMGIAKADPRRMQAGVAYCLDRIASNGDTWSTREGLLDMAVQELRPDTLDAEDRIFAALEDLIDLGLVHQDVSPVGEEVVADAYIAATEFEVFAQLRSRLAASADVLSVDGTRAREAAESLNAGQRAGLTAALSCMASVISGAGGVGKTYTMRAICEIAEENGVRVGLCAPTGKAARKLGHATRRDALTIHRLLEPMFDERAQRFRFLRDSMNPVDFGLVIVDEVSMCDVKLMRSLLSALRPSCRLLLVGDHNQIPPVGAGAILRDLLSARDRYPQSIHVLTEIVRQAGELAVNTRALLDGLIPPPAAGSVAWQVHHTERGHEDGCAAIASSIVEMIVTSPDPLPPFGRHLSMEWDVQVLSPQRKGPLGTYALNAHLQRLRARLLGNPEPQLPKENDPPPPVVGDRVIWTKNDYELSLYNGTQAIVIGMPKGGGMVLFTEDGQEVTVPVAKRGNVEVAYAMTIHKCVAGDTLIETCNGWQRIDEVGQGEGLVATVTEPTGFDRFIEREEGGLLRITVEGGYRIEVTPDHKMRTFGGKLWSFVEAHRLSTGDWLRMKLGHSGFPCDAVHLPSVCQGDVRARVITTPDILDLDTAEFFGLMVADGTRYRAGCRLAKRHIDVVERFAELGERLFGLTAHRGEINGTPYAEFNSTILSSWLTDVGGMEPNAKSIPRCVMEAARPIRAAFLRGLFEDGWVNTKAGVLDHIGWTNCSENLVRTVQTILLEFGVVSSIGRYGDLHRLGIYSEGAVRFRESIGFVSSFKNERLSGARIPRNTRHRIPVNRNGFSCRTSTGQNARYRGYVSRASAEDLGMHSELMFHYARIVSVERIRGRSYCLSVPMGRAFLQNRFDGSNSQGSEWPFVLLVAGSPHWNMHDRNLLYTGASRASESLMIMGDRQGLARFAKERKSENRQTFGAWLVHGWSPSMKQPQGVVSDLERTR